MVGCSLYQSEGRKYLEKRAFEYAQSTALAHSQGCGYNQSGNPDGQWVVIQETPQAVVKASETENYQVHVESKLEPAGFSCQYQFDSAQEMYETSKAAIDLTLLHQSLGEFAFRPLSHLK
jgi:hypothetical protein